ncbi:hypothetical protein OEZ71_12335 [Defluviimonas sp. WL0050]|uniref:Uncharacterized protein n=1 Tax=Albidovulum litorale TaxID=2984134 RepID=A0ABT2ZPX7_9RHOB|nr:hypothetical protein [Defluviimonas sp. WL0050]MCV2873082.1 hypothetical protein [Defluviimonas sp. WL0050]
MFGLGHGRGPVQEPADAFDSRHTSGVREAIQAAAVIWIGGTILFSSVELAWLPRFGKIGLVLSLGAGAGLLVARWVRKLNTPVSAWQHGVAFANLDATDPRNGNGEAVRAAREAETQKQLARQKADLIARLQAEKEGREQR